MSLKNLKDKLEGLNLSPSFGQIIEITANLIVGEGLSVSVGDIVHIYNDDKNSNGMVVKITIDRFYVTPFGFVEGLKIGDKINVQNDGLNIGVGEALLGRIISPFGEALDDKGAIHTDGFAPIITAPIKPMNRPLITEVFSVGVKSIDGLLTCGKGQKLGIFAGSGVGKSTLLSMIVKGCSKEYIKVIALIGERGREVREFIEKNLAGDLTNTVIIIATSDDSPLMRKYGAFSAMAIAEYFKDLNKDVLFIMDSVTRFAMAQREIGLSLGEPPTAKGYPPSALSILPQLMERAGLESGKGSISAFFTVLVEGDNLSEDPIADQSRSILDGHIVLDRKLTESGLYPPIDVLGSASRVMGEVVSSEHKLAINRFKALYSSLKENEVLIRIGSYKGGSDALLDEAIAKKPAMEDFLKQGGDEQLAYADIVGQLELLTS